MGHNVCTHAINFKPAAPRQAEENRDAKPELRINYATSDCLV